METLFEILIACHVATGAVGLVAFWGPVATRKGGTTHGRWGRVFVDMMLATGALACAMAICTLIDPVGTHPHLTLSAEVIRTVFGWLMLHLGLLTIALAWHGRLCVRHRRDRVACRGPLNLALQGALALAAVNCAAQGFLNGLPLLAGMAAVGIATAATNLHHLYRRSPGPNAWLREHVKCHVGAGISVYTAFFAFGAVRLLPAAALSPALWAAPLTVGLAMILFHWRRIDRGRATLAGRGA